MLAPAIFHAGEACCLITIFWNCVNGREPGATWFVAPRHPAAAHPRRPTKGIRESADFQTCYESRLRSHPWKFRTVTGQGNALCSEHGACLATTPCTASMRLTPIKSADQCLCNETELNEKDQFLTVPAEAGDIASQGSSARVGESWLVFRDPVRSERENGAPDTAGFVAPAIVTRAGEVAKLPQHQFSPFASLFIFFWGLGMRSSAQSPNLMLAKA